MPAVRPKSRVAYVSYDHDTGGAGGYSRKTHENDVAELRKDKHCLRLPRHTVICDRKSPGLARLSLGLARPSVGDSILHQVELLTVFSWK